MYNNNVRWYITYQSNVGIGKDFGYLPLYGIVFAVSEVYRYI